MSEHGHAPRGWVSWVSRLACLGMSPLTVTACYSATNGPGDDGPASSTSADCLDLSAAPLCDPAHLDATAPESVEIDSLAPGARFTLLGGKAGLIERPVPGNEGRFAVATILPTAGTPLFEFATAEVEAEMSVPGVFGSCEIPGFELTAFALVCLKGDGCGLWGTYIHEEILHPLDLPKVPTEVGAPLLAMGAESGVCVYDQKVACLTAEKTWELAPALPAQTGERIVLLLPGSALDSTLALTDAGIVVERTASSAWSTWDEATVGQITGLERSENSLLVWGEKGLWDSRLTAGAQHVCDSDAIMSAHAFRHTGQTALFFKQGDFYLWGPDHDTGEDTWCRWPSALDLPNLGTAYLDCPSSPALMSLSSERATSLLGSPYCVRR